MKNLIPALALLACCAIQPAFAYIDPGTGSALLQGLIAGAAALVVFWRRIVEAVSQFFHRRGDFHRDE